MEENHPLLDFAAIERGMFNEQLWTLGNLVRVTGASVIEANVLRYVYDAGGCQRGIPLESSRMAASPWIMASERSVRRAVAFWETAGIIEVERDQRDAGGRKAPSIARLLWGSVLRRLVGEARPVATSPVAHGREALPADYRGGSDPRGSRPVFFPAPAASVSMLAATESNLAATESDLAATVSAPTARESKLAATLAASNGETRNPIRAIARARGLLVSSSVFSVDVDSAEGEEAARKIIEFSAVVALAEEARRPLYRDWPREPQVPQLFVAASVLGLSVFSRDWVLAATQATRSAPSAANHAWRYWVGCLRNGLVEVEGLPRFESREEAASYFAQLTRAVEPVTTAIMGEYADAFRRETPAQHATDRRPIKQQHAEAVASWQGQPSLGESLRLATKGGRQ